MKKLLYSYIVIILVGVGVFVPGFSKAEDALSTTTTSTVSSSDKIEFILFHSETCPHCKDEIKFIDKKLRPEYSDYVDFQLYEINDPVNQELMQQYGHYYNADVRGVPLTIVGGEVVYGYGNDKTTGQQILDIIENKLFEKDGGEINTTSPVCGVGSESCVQVPILGKIDIKTFSLPILTIIIGLLDGFNPCAMWVLLFLITLLLNMKDRKRMWLLGSIFILVSGVVYFIFMAAWLEFLMFIGMILIVRLAIGGLAVWMGSKTIHSFWKNRKADGVVCEVSNKDGTKKTFEKIKDVVYKKSLLISIIGIVVLGFSVNLVELACSAGFPAIFTQILSMSEVSSLQKYLYMAGYIFFYMLDDMVVFAIAMVTLQSKTLGGKYAKYTNLIAGVLILILGVLLILKPEWLMFS